MTKFLSFAGRVELIQSVLLNSLAYWSQSFKIPISLCKEFERITVFFGTRKCMLGDGMLFANLKRKGVLN